MEKINSFLETILDYLDSGKIYRKPFKWLYWVIGVMLTIGILTSIVSIFNMFRYAEGVEYVGLVLIILVLFATAVFAVIYWVRRAKDVENVVDVNARFVAIPVVSHLIRTSGEFFGIAIGISGTVIFLFALLFVGHRFLGTEGGLGLVCCPVIGYLNILLSRFFAESLAVVTSIANDTRSLVEKSSEQKAEPKEEVKEEISEETPEE